MLRKDEAKAEENVNQGESREENAELGELKNHLKIWLAFGSWGGPLKDQDLTNFHHFYNPAIL